MKIENKVKASVSGLSIPKVIGKMSHVLTSITNNTNFVLVPEPTVAAAMLSELQVLEGRVASGDRTAVPLRTNKLAEVISLLNSWVAQVNVQAQGNVARLESSGFEFVRGREPRPMPKPVTKLVVKDGTQSGEVSLYWKGSTDAKTYKLQYRIASANGAEWTTIDNIFKNRHDLSNLGKAVIYEFRVCGVNTAGMGAFSDVASIVTQ